MTNCFFATDVHGNREKYRKLFAAVRRERPAAVFIGGDILPTGLAAIAPTAEHQADFVTSFLAANFEKLRAELDAEAPRVFIILGNDDGRFEEAAVLDAAARGVWEYIHDRRVMLGEYSVFGYNYVPPSPLMLKDWERYDVSRYVDPGCVSPEEGYRSIPVSDHEKKYRTIADDLARLTADRPMDKAIFLFHTPPYMTGLDRAALDGKMVDYVPLDVHVGSIAVQRFIESRQPLVTLHGHIHESARLTGAWRHDIGRTGCFSAAHDGPELALVRFSPEQPQAATRELI